MIQIIIIFAVVILIIYAVVGFWGKRYSLRVVNFNIGGINVFFDKSSEIFVKAVGGFIASKEHYLNLIKKEIILVRFWIPTTQHISLSWRT